MTTNNLDTTALERIMKARVELIMSRTFYGVLVSQVEPVISRKVPTMATDGRKHYANPDFIATLTQNEVLGVQTHESEHDARRHHTRRMGRDPKLWNEACDFAINPDLIDQGFTLPKGALIDVKYKGMSAEDIYRSREIDRALEKQKQEQKQEQDDSEDTESNETDDAEDSSDDSTASDQPSNEGGEDDEAGHGAARLGQAKHGVAQPSLAGESEAGDEPASQPDKDKAGAEEAGDEANDETGDETNSASSEAGDLTADETGANASELCSTGDPGGCGEVLDAADTTAELASEDARWETTFRQASMLAAKRGTAPGHIARELEHADHPPTDWKETLRAFFDGGATTQETWSRPNRRLIGSGLYLPGRQRDGVNKAYFLIDTSGSVTFYPGALEAIKTETQAALDEGIIDEAVVIYGDTRVTRVDEYRNGDEIEFDPRGGGGTMMKPLFDYVRDMADASLIVCFTDLEIETESQLGPEPDCPVLWAVVGYPQSVKRYLKATPWDATGIEVVPSYN
jgi:predicted metal-dependent peptidase